MEMARPCCSPTGASRYEKRRRATFVLHERDRGTALADARGDALDAAMAHVAGREDAGHARLQQVGVAVERPRRGCEIRDIAPSAHEAASVADDLLGQPTGVRIGSD